MGLQELLDDLFEALVSAAGVGLFVQRISRVSAILVQCQHRMGVSSRLDTTTGCSLQAGRTYSRPLSFSAEASPIIILQIFL